LKKKDRKYELVVENRSIDRKCIVIGLPFMRKYPTEFNFDPSLYIETETKGFDILGFMKNSTF